MGTTIDDVKWNNLISSIETLTTSHNTLSSDIKGTNEFLKALSLKVNNCEDRMSRAERALSLLEQQARSRNVILFNFNDTNDTNSNLLVNVKLIFNKVGLDIPESAFDDIFRLGKRLGSRPVLIKFVASRWVRDVFSEIRDFKYQGFIIVNDRSPEERERRKVLLSHVQELRGKGHSAFLRGNKIIVDDVAIPQDKVDLILSNALPGQQGSSASNKPDTSARTSLSQTFQQNKNVAQINASKKRGRPPSFTGKKNKKSAIRKVLDDSLGPSAANNSFDSHMNESLMDDHDVLQNE